MPKYRCTLYNSFDKNVKPKQIDITAKNEDEAYDIVYHSKDCKSGQYTDLNTKKIQD